MNQGQLASRAEAGEKSAVSAEKVTCKFCAEAIAARARICHHCGRPQKWWKVQYLELASLLGVVIALALLVLSALQYADSRKDRIEAEKALEQSTAALRRASLAESQLKDQQLAINRYSENLFSSICIISGGVFHVSTITCQLVDGTAIRYESVFRNGGPGQGGVKGQ